MAILINTRPSDSALFCCSKWWGNPDLPPQVEYPTMDITDEDGRPGKYPLTFICQIDCADIAPFDPEGRLPHEGMLYFFAAIDEYLGYDTPEHFGIGQWDRKAVVVKYAKAINMETFNSCILVDDEDRELAEPERAVEFSACDAAADGIKLLGVPFFEEVRELSEGCTNLLQLDCDDSLGLRFYDGGTLNILIRDSDLSFGNWKRAFGYMHSL